MKSVFRLELQYFGEGYVEKEIEYHGDTAEEIARDADKDENELLNYMLTHDERGQKSFCFRGFMFRKEGLITARMYEPDY